MNVQSVDIYIPTYGRADKLPGVVDNIEKNTKYPHRIVLLLENDDTRSIDVAKGMEITVIMNRRSETYAGAVNTAWEDLQSECFFAGADDLNFKDGWLETAISKMDESHRVIGTNDLHNMEVVRGEHATHYLVHGSYIKDFTGTIDRSFPVLYEYDHNWTDREFIGTAKFRGEFIPCMDSVVEHLHFVFGLAPCDATYEKGRKHLDQDQALYERRRDQWGRL